MTFTGSDLSTVLTPGAYLEDTHMDQYIYALRASTRRDKDNFPSAGKFALVGSQFYVSYNY